MKDVAIFGVPRSGTSWLGQIFNSSPNVVYRYQPIFAYSFPASLSEDSTEREIKSFHQDLLTTNDEFVCQKTNISGNRTPQFKKEGITHLVWKEVRYLNIIENLIQQSPTKVVGIVRHPCGVIKSWMNAPKEFNPEWNIKDEWKFAHKKNSGKYEYYGYERWIKATRLFVKLEENYPQQFKTVTYEALLESPEKNSSSLFDYVGLDMNTQTSVFLNQSMTTASNDPYDVFRKDKKGDEWKRGLPSEIIDSILNDERFKKLAQRFKWETSKEPGI